MVESEIKKIREVEKEPVIEKVESKALFESDIKFKIFNLMNIYPELSYSEIAKKLKKSKSTLHTHIQELLESGLIIVSREEKVRGNIPAKYYSINPETVGKLLVSKKGSIDCGTKISIGKNWLNYLKSNLELYLKFYKKIEKDPKPEEALQQIEGCATFSTYFTKNSFIKFKGYYDQIIAKVLDLEKEQLENEPNEEKSYFLFLMSIPLGIAIKGLDKN